VRLPLPLDLVAALFVVLIVSLSVHEAAHAWTADRLGDPTARMLGRLTINPVRHVEFFGTIVFPLMAMLSGLPILGWAKPVPVDVRRLRAPRRDFAIVALAGPVSNLLLAMAAAIVLKVMLAADAGSGFWLGLVARMVTTNVLLAVFNLLPVPPLDGGNVLAGLVPEPVARGIDRLRPYGILVLYALIFTGILGDVVYPIQRRISGWLV
jgi:Zn-dependent protease